MARPFVQDFREAVRDSDIPATDKSVLRTMETYAKGDGTGVRASLGTIARGANISRRACVFAVRRAQQAGWLKQVSSGKSARVPSEYRLRIGQLYTISYADGKRGALLANESTERVSEQNATSTTDSDISLVNEKALAGERNATQLENVGHHKQVPLGTSTKELAVARRGIDECDPLGDHQTKSSKSQPQRDSFADEGSLSLVMSPILARQYAALAESGHEIDHDLDREHAPSALSSDCTNKRKGYADGCSVCGETANPDGISLVCFGCGHSSKNCRCHVKGTRRKLRCDSHLNFN